MSDSSPISGSTTLAVLAGGQGSRMGTEKGLLRVRGEPILLHLLQQLRWSGSTMLVTARHRTPPPGAELFNRVAVDAVDGQGPLRGVLTALENSPGDVVAITIDMPAITRDMLESLVEALRIQPQLDGLMLEGSFDGGTRVEPFPSIYRQSARTAIATALSQNRRSLCGLLHDSKFAAMPTPDDWPTSVWTNLNSPADLEAFEKWPHGRDKM